MSFFDEPNITTLKDLEAAKEQAGERARQAGGRLLPNQAWCLWCERVFTPRDFDKQKRCGLGDCDEIYHRYRLLEGKLAGRCPDCNGSRGRHSECKGQAMIQAGLPDGPCPYCGGYPGAHAAGCQVIYFLRQDGLCSLCGRELDVTIPYPEPDYVNRDHILPQSYSEQAHHPGNIELTHKRCNEWKANNPAPFGQPTWGILTGIPKVIGYYQARVRHG